MQIESGYEALQVWNKEAIISTPFYLKIWLGIMAISLLSSLIFIKNLGARAVFIFTSLGLLFTKLIAPQLGLTVYSGLVALTHVALWPLSLYFLYRDYFVIKTGLYRFWIYWVSIIIMISLIFDVRDAYKYIAFILES